VSERFRVAIIILALGAVALGCYDVANPYRPGQIGFDGPTLANGNQRFGTIYPRAAADRAGIRRHDVLLIDSLSSRQQFDLAMRRAGQPLDLPILRNGKRLNFHITAETTENFRPVETGPIELLLLVIFAATGMLVALRGAARPEVRALALLFVAWAWSIALAWLFEVAPTTQLAFVGAVGGGGGPATTQGFVEAFVAYGLLIFVGYFPPPRSRLRSAIAASALPISVLILLVAVWSDVSVSHASWQLFEIRGIASFGWIGAVLGYGVVPVLVLVGAIDGLMHVDEEHRIQMRWVGAALIITAVPPFYALGFLLYGGPAPPLFTWLRVLSDVPFLLIAYAILRHRIVDVSIVISRAAIFAIVSAVVVVLVIALVWTLGQILSRGIGAEAANGVTGQALRLAVAVGVGLSAVPILRLVERWLNSVFFGKREQALAELRRFALEADVVTSTASLLTLTCDSLRENIEGRYAAIYMLENGGYSCVRSSNEAPPPVLGKDDAAIVRLRRWNEPFEMNAGLHALSEALMLPMTIGGSLIGVLVCGPKRERIHYLNEEIETLALVAHRVGTAAYVLLQRDAHLDGVATLRGDMTQAGAPVVPAGAV
jgi:hypothetical protein